MADPAVTRAAALLVPVALTLGVLVWRQPSSRVVATALLAFLWNCVTLPAANLFAVDLGWWSFAFEGGGFMGMPADLLIGWAFLWGPLPVLALGRVPFAYVVGGLAWVDLAVMPAMDPVVELGGAWLAGEALTLLICLVPALLLSRLTLERTQLATRVGMQMTLFAGLSFFLVPSIVFDATGSGWAEHVEAISLTEAFLWLQLAAVPGAVAVTAVLAFASIGRGTPYPWDPPSRLVSSGPYAYVANPMQLSMTLLLLLASIALRDIWLLVAAALAVVFSAGIAEWNEHAHLQGRFESAFADYRRTVRNWFPRLRPSPLRPEAILYVGYTCGECSSLGAWLMRRAPIGLSLAPAEQHPEKLRRVRYECKDGTTRSGVRAVAAALEHVNLFYALAAWLLAIPVVAHIAQLLADAVGGGPRDLVATGRRWETPPKRRSSKNQTANTSPFD